MKTFFAILVMSFLFSCGEETIANLTAENPPEVLVDIPIAQPAVEGPIIELVFCLDATGSMSGLIATAKEKIWSIVSELLKRNQLQGLNWEWYFTETEVMHISLK